MRKQGSVLITVPLECEVHYEETTAEYGANADGRLGIIEVERTPLWVEVHTVVPKAAEGWVKLAALDLFEAQERG